MPNEEFRQAVVSAGEKAVEIVRKHLDGAPVSAGKLGVASRTLGQAIKVEQMDQIREQQRFSNGFRLASFLKEPQARQQFVEAMRPRIAEGMNQRQLTTGKKSAKT